MNWIPTWLAGYYQQAAQKIVRPSTPQPTSAPVFSGKPVNQATLERTSQPPRRYGKVLFTLDSLRRAWLAIKQAGGGAGVDGMTIAHFEEGLASHLAELGQELNGGSYRPRPVRQVLVPKESGGLRPLALWALRDRIAQRAVYEAVLPLFDPHFLPCSFGFRPDRSVEDAIQSLLRQRNSHLRWVVDADILHCFDEIDRSLLLKRVRQRLHEPRLLRYVDGWLQADILNSADGMPRKAGTSQGNVLSPLLANIYLHDFDQQLCQQGLVLVRYADDFVICCRRKEEAQQALEQARQALATLKLSIHPQKTQITHFDQGFRWLGYFFIKNEYYRL